MYSVLHWFQNSRGNSHPLKVEPGGGELFLPKMPEDLVIVPACETYVHL